MRRLLAASILVLPLLAAPPALADDKVMLQLGESAERVVTQDRLRAQLRVEAGGGDPKQIQAQVNQKMAKALERAKAIGTIKAETQGYFVYEDKSLKRGQRWWGSQSLGLTSTDSASLLALVGQLQEDGMVMSGLNYELAPETRRAIERDLLPEAIQRLKDTAATVAGSLGLPKVEIVKLRVGEPSMPPQNFRAMAAPMAMAEKSAAPVAEPGESMVSIRIEAEIALTR